MSIITTINDPRFAACQAIRRTVFIEEQNVPQSREQDGLDATATHYLFSHQGNYIGTARSRIEGDYIKIERFALLPETRGLGLGASAFTAIIEHCLKMAPDKKITIGAQAYLQRFYEKIGFAAEGGLFEDAGIPHIKMSYVKNH